MPEYGSPKSSGSVELEETMANPQFGLVPISGPLAGKIFYLKPDVTIIGRAPDSDVPLSGRGVARHHAGIRRRGRDEASFLLYDLSESGEFDDLLLNDSLLFLRESLLPGDRITVGDIVLQFLITG